MTAAPHAPPTRVRTPDLARAVADYTQVLGFACPQQIPGVWALLELGPLRLQLWACGARPGRWERATPGERGFLPARHRLTVEHIHALHAHLRRAVQRPCRSGIAGCEAPHAGRLPTAGPQLQPWGAWEFELTDVDGNVLHLIDWSVWRPGAAAPAVTTTPKAAEGGT